MDEGILKLIQDYLDAVSMAMGMLLAHIGEDRLMQGSPGHAYPRQGALSDGWEYSFHGIGCCVISEEDISIDWDFSPDGQACGFDAWRLWCYSKQFQDRYPRLQEREVIEEKLQPLLDEGVIGPSGVEYDNLLYLRGAT